jgi:hypothetical protein
MTTAEMVLPQNVTWSPQPEAAAIARDLLDEACQVSSRLAEFGRELAERTGTRLFDWVDHFKLPVGHPLADQLRELGFVGEDCDLGIVWRHPAAMVPPIIVCNATSRTVALKVESVDAFLLVNGWADKFVDKDDRRGVIGAAGGQLRAARVAYDRGVEVFVVERHGWPNFTTVEDTPEEIDAAERHFEAFRNRRRIFEIETQGYTHAVERIRAAAGERRARPRVGEPRPPHLSIKPQELFAARQCL